MEENQVVETTEVPSTPTPETPSTPAVETPSSPPPTEGAPAEGAEAAAPSYTPDFKFSAYGEEGEIEENFRQYIKDKQSEESFKKLYSKAHAFEKAREKLDRTRGDYQKTSSALQEYEGAVQELKTHVKNNDFDSFFKRMNIPMEAVWKWVEQKAQYQELSPEQKMQYDEAMRLRRENSELQNKYKSTDETYNQTMSRLANMELDFALSKPEVREYQEAYDVKRGRKGAFREFVIDRGLALESKTRKECSAEDAIKDALEWLDFSPNPGANQSQSPQPLVAKSSNKPVIPNMKGGGTAPVKKRPQNLKELRAEIERRQQANS